MNDQEVNKIISETNERIILLKKALDVAIAGLCAINIHNNTIAEKTLEEIKLILKKE